MDKFQNEKNQFLAKKDRSRKGSIDLKIRRLVNKINSFDQFYTTSSCAGRILLFSEGKKKHDVKWIFCSHDKIKKIEAKILKETVYFKQEGFIIHVACDSIESATALLSIANKAGIRRAGIKALTNKIIVEISSSNQFETIFSRNNKIIITNEYQKELIAEANKVELARAVKLLTNFINQKI